MVIPLLGVKTRCADKSTAEHYEHTYIWRQVLHTPGPEMYPGMCTYCFTLKKAHLIICPVFIRASNFGTRSMKYEAHVKLFCKGLPRETTQNFRQISLIR